MCLWFCEALAPILINGNDGLNMFNFSNFVLYGILGFVIELSVPSVLIFILLLVIYYIVVCVCMYIVSLAQRDPEVSASQRSGS